MAVSPSNTNTLHLDREASTTTKKLCCCSNKDNCANISRSRNTICSAPAHQPTPNYPSLANQHRAVLCSIDLKPLWGAEYAWGGVGAIVQCGGWLWPIDGRGAEVDLSCSPHHLVMVAHLGWGETDMLRMYVHLYWHIKCDTFALKGNNLLDYNIC